MFVEFNMSRGKETFHVGGILRIVPASDHARIYLFGTPQPIDVQEKYEDVVAKCIGRLPATASIMDGVLAELREAEEVESD